MSPETQLRIWVVGCEGGLWGEARVLVVRWVGEARVLVGGVWKISA